MNDLSKTTITLSYILARDTKGALVYQEVDQNGNVLDIAGGAVNGTLYLRKNKVVGEPKHLTVTITVPK